MVDPSEVRIEAYKPEAQRPRRIWWGLVGTLVGAFCGFIAIPEVGHGWWEESRDEALKIIYTASAGAALGFAFELTRQPVKGRFKVRSFGLKSFLLFCYAVAVAIYIVNGLLTLHTLE